jgi:hypothetical protein
MVSRNVKIERERDVSICICSSYAYFRKNLKIIISLLTIIIYLQRSLISIHSQIHTSCRPNRNECIILRRIIRQKLENKKWSAIELRLTHRIHLMTRLLARASRRTPGGLSIQRMSQNFHFR